MVAGARTLLITGGSGYVASVLLSKFGAASQFSTSSSPEQNKEEWISDMSNVSEIILVDKVQPNLDDWNFPITVVCIEVDILNLDLLKEAFRGVDAVYHLASYGMSGKEQLNRETIWNVNVQGTKNVLEACKFNNIKTLVFTSTYNVVFGGQKIEDGDESLPYFESNQRSWDNYGNTKTEAEKLVLQSDGGLTKDGRTVLKTCALRLAGIYGPGEKRHLPRVAKAMRQGMFVFTYGDNPIVDFVHVENVAQAVLRAHAVLEEPLSKAAGQAYFISDNKPINNFEFFRPMTEALNIPFPKLSVPIWLVYFIAFLIETLYSMVHRFYDFQPLLCRAEVYKTGQTHYFSIEKARRDLGYEPQYQNDMATVSEEYRALTPPNHNCDKRDQASCSRILVNLCLGILIFSLMMSFLPTTV